MVAMEQGVTDKRCDICRAPMTCIPCRRCPISRIERQELGMDELEGPRGSAIYLDEGKLRLEGELGRGGMGTVFCAVDETLERIVAVKFLRPELQADPEMVERFRREAKATASISHKNVVTIYSSGQFGSSDYFVSEYLDGSSLERLIEVARNTKAPLPVHCGLWIIDHVCAGLAAVHAGGVVHRDVKPGNVMIEADSGRVVIMDFGIGGVLEEGETSVSSHSVGGTPGYMAPEAFYDGRGVDGSFQPPDGRLSDIYSLGVTAYETLTGLLPFRGKNIMEIMHKHIDEQPRRPSSIRRDLPRGFDDIVLRCLAKDPLDRYESCNDVRTAIASLQAEIREIEPSKSVDAETSTTRKAVELVGRSVDDLRVIVADPDPGFVANVQEAVRSIASWGFVQAARSPRKALELARRVPPTILIAPLHDDDLDGFEMASIIAGDETLRSTRLIVTATNISSDEHRRLHQQSGIPVLLMPADRDNVAEVVEHVLWDR